MKNSGISSIKKNYIFNFLYQILTIIIPLFTIPYVARVIGVEGIGIYSYTYSIAFYFTLLILLGIPYYGTREIAKVRNDTKKMSNTFWEIYTIQLSSSIIIILIFFIYIVFFSKNYQYFLLLQFANIVSSVFDVTWFFNGIENFKLIVVRNAIVKVIATICIFCFVRTSYDLWIYILILSLTTFFSQILIFSSIRKYIDRYSIGNIKRHIKPILIMFIPVIAVSLYKIMDKIMLGYLTNMLEVGYYENAEKIINVPIILISCLGTVMMPNASNLIKNNKEDIVKNTISMSVYFQLFIALPISVGLILVSKRLVIIYLGEQFIKSALLIVILVLTIPFISLQSVYKMQYIIPKERDKDYIMATIYGAVINVVLNLILIPLYKSIGAAIATVFAEIFAMIYILFSVKKDINLKQDILNVIPIFLKTMIMGIFVYLISLIKINNILITLFTQIFLGIIIYVILNYKYIMINLIRSVKNEKTS